MANEPFEISLHHLNEEERLDGELREESSVESEVKN